MQPSDRVACVRSWVPSPSLPKKKKKAMMKLGVIRQMDF
jgi:hypothetical protein